MERAAMAVAEGVVAAKLTLKNAAPLQRPIGRRFHLPASTHARSACASDYHLPRPTMCSACWSTPGWSGN
jgi:ferric iron reductase protein FhuF